METQRIIEIKQDYYDDVEDFRRHLSDAYFTVMNYARRGDDMSISDLASNLYVIEFLLNECEITIKSA